MTKNNHARTKENKRRLKLKSLRLASFWKRVFKKRAESIHKAKQPKGRTITGEVKKTAPFVSLDAKLFKARNSKYPNQRQQRKKWRQNPHMRKSKSI